MKNKLLVIKAKRPTETKEFKSLLPQLKKLIPWAEYPSEIYYCIVNDIVEQPTCKYCGGSKTYYSTNKGYSHTCGSKSCAAKYSFELYPELKEEFISHRDKANTSEANKKRRKTLKIINSDPIKIERTRKNMQAKYGVDNVFQLDTVKEKSKETCLEKYGVEHHYHDPSIFNKVFTKKEYTFPSGRVEHIQGYEDIAINELLLEYDEDDLIISDTDTPVIYYSLNGKKHRYYCDIWIPKDNLVVEVKSDYTWEAELDKNKAKEKATIASGFEFKLMKYASR